MRRTLALVGLLVMVVLAGCTGSVVREADLQKQATYDWNTSAAVTVTVSGSQYQTVYTLDNESEVALSIHDELSGTQPIPISAVKFRYTNGTVVNASALTVEEKDRQTVVTFPAREGQFAYTAETGSRNLLVPALTNRSHEVVLPPGMRIGFPIFGGATPGGYETTITDDRVHIRWSSVSTDRISVDYYAERDLYIFAGVVALLLLVAGGGALYYRSVIRRLEAQREAAGLDVEDDS